MVDNMTMPTSRILGKGESRPVKRGTSLAIEHIPPIIPRGVWPRWSTLKHVTLQSAWTCFHRFIMVSYFQLYGTWSCFFFWFHSFLLLCSILQYLSQLFITLCQYDGSSQVDQLFSAMLRSTCASALLNISSGAVLNRTGESVHPCQTPYMIFTFHLLVCAVPPLWVWTPF